MKTTGSPHVKNGKWYAVLSIPDSTGKKKQKWIALGLDKKGNALNAKEKTNELIVKYNAGQVIFSENILFSEYVSRWLDRHAKEVAETTMQGYRTYAERDIYPYFNERGTILQDIRPIDIQEFYDYLRGPRGLCEASVSRYRTVINGALKNAYRLGMIASNPADRAVIPKSPKKAMVGQSYSAEEVNALFSCIKSEPIYPAVFLTVHLGLRREEVLGLKWDAIDFTNHKIHIRHTRTRVREEVARDNTKTLLSNRELKMTNDVYSFLKQLQREQLEDQLRLGADYLRTEYVCRFKNGKPLSPDYVSTRFRILLERNALRHIRFHDLRDTTANLMRDNGVDLKTIQEYLGHNSIKTTADRYIQPSFEAKAAAGETLSALLTSACG